MSITAFDCNEADICHENAECIYDQVVQKYTCECVEGFSGDGRYCERYDVGKSFHDLIIIVCIFILCITAPISAMMINLF